MIMDARQDLTQVAPLIDNYNKLIESYEIGLGKKDKPDPSMFEMGAGNAQGSAAGMAGNIMAGMAGMAGNKYRTGENLSILGYDTGIDSSAILANQGGPITRRRN